jgi:uncharacterized Tic20 family protein
MEEKQWALFCHLSGLSGYIIPFGNIIVPLVIWSVKKDESEMIDEHGKEAANFQISFSIWIAIAIVFSIVLIGIPFLIAFATLHIVFIIIASLKADKGQLYKYPLTIRFIK